MNFWKWVVDRVALSTPYLDQPAIGTRTHGDRLFWDRFSEFDSCQSSVNSMTNRDTKTDKDVLATLQGFSYQHKSK